MTNINNGYAYYALLDYDGYICKAFYANKEDPMNMTASATILKDLELAAVEKMSAYFNTPKDTIRLIRIISGHSWKKDIYPSYKRQRKRDEYLGMFRDKVKTYPSIRLVPQLEADEAIVLISDYLQSINKDNYIVFSDDKDLRYYCPKCCKINITEEVVKQDNLDVYKSQLIQMLAGDSEDNIKGIPRVGMKTGEKLLDKYGYDLKSVIRCFKDNEIDIDNCLRDLLLIIPLAKEYRDENTLAEESIVTDLLEGRRVIDAHVCTLLINQIQFLSKIVKEVYDEKD